MWLFTKYGFFSVVAAVDEKNRLDPTRVVVRARDAAHLRTLKRQFGLGEEITREQDRDYPARMVLDHDRWAKVAYQLAEDIDYSNFKGAVFKREGHTRYEQVLHRIWTVGLDITPAALAKRVTRFFHTPEGDDQHG